MNEAAKRISELTPEKRRLLDQLIRGQVDIEREPGESPSSVASDNGLPNEAKETCKTFFDQVTQQLDWTPYGHFSCFLNFGYVADSSTQEALVQLPEYYLNKNSVKLVLEIIGDCAVQGKRVLDVGCGRGGTVQVLKEFFAPASVHAIDLAPAAIAFCRRAHKHTGVTFLEGDAERIPFEDESMDIVTNLESSSCYPNIIDFYGEVWRVLVPGGWFLYSDCLPIEKVREGKIYLEKLGFIIERDRDITRNVILSCDEVARLRTQSFGDGQNSPVLADFLGTPGSPVYESMRTGMWPYFILGLRKPMTGEAHDG
jgi:phthiocerol/phenolphthiocerol synthesis type-I polyketide synthase E